MFAYDHREKDGQIDCTIIVIIEQLQCLVHPFDIEGEFSPIVGSAINKLVHASTTNTPFFV